MEKRRFSAFLLTLLCLSLLAGCSGTAATQPAVTQVVTEAIKTGAATSTILPTVAPSATPEPTFTPTPAGCQEAGKVTITQFYTNMQPEALQVRVYLPPCYSETPDTPYPVLYMIHGQTYDDTQWERLGITTAADQLIQSGRTRPFLIIMPLEKHTEREPSENKFDDVIREALVPWVDSNYPTCAERECRAIGGLSRGATWAVHLGFMYPGLFGKIGGHSLTPFFGDVYALPYWIMNIEVSDLPEFYLDIGDDDPFVPPATEFHDKMVELGVVSEWIRRPGEHKETYWSEHTPEYLEWYTKDWLPIN